MKLISHISQIHKDRKTRVGQMKYRNTGEPSYRVGMDDSGLIDTTEY